MEFNSFDEFKEKFKIFAHIRYSFKKRFLRKSSKPGLGNLVLIELQVELSKLKFSYDDIRTNFLQVLLWFFKIVVL